MYYVALVHADERGIGFTIPDVPGFTADIETTDMDAAVAEATKILAGHLAELKAAGGKMPTARSITELRGDPEHRPDIESATGLVFLPGLTPMGRTVRVNLSLDEGTLALIDREAQERGVTRSALVQAAAHALVEQRTRGAKASAFDVM